MAVTFDASHHTDITTTAFAEHFIREGDAVRCFKTGDNRARARRPLPGEKITGAALHDALPGLPVTVVVCKRGE